MSYIDAFVIPLPKKKLAAYRTMARFGCKLWREHGALDYKECLGHDLKTPWALGFPQGLRLKAGETVVFSWILFKSKSHRDQVNKKVMADPRMEKFMDPKKMPFDAKRMLYGGFKVMVSA